eukprot:TRINITY_DN73091_c0_g1_i1.p1 TRINITY_DN73091_c0_g1~~TRINITY_DN73091_c0_g1_i1.p1  ORF type:complete len:113 (-),score=4.97 TRINITY_DN73091_c0_g1_i1:123-461(-)
MKPVCMKELISGVFQRRASNDTFATIVCMAHGAHRCTKHEARTSCARPTLTIPLVKIHCELLAANAAPRSLTDLAPLRCSRVAAFAIAPTLTSIHSSSHQKWAQEHNHDHHG